MEELIENEYGKIFEAIMELMNERNLSRWDYFSLEKDKNIFTLLKDKIGESLYQKITTSLYFNSFLDFSFWQLRKHCIHTYSFAIPSDKVLKYIKKYEPLVEMGAGSGYWAWLLQRKFKCDIIPVDKYPPREGENEWFRKEWTFITKGEPKMLEAMPYRNLFLCWCNYDDPFGSECLRYFKGKYALIVTEGEGGCIGDDFFHMILEKKFKFIKNVHIPHWFGIHDYLAIYKRI